MGKFPSSSSHQLNRDEVYVGFPAEKKRDGLTYWFVDSNAEYYLAVNRAALRDYDIYR